MTLEEIRMAAEKNISYDLWEWINGGTETESTLHRNRSALERISLRLKVLHGLKKADTSVTVLGQRLQAPIIVAPFANMGRLHPEAEMAIARGAARAGAMMFLGPVPGAAIQQIVGTVDTPVVWNGEPLKDRQRIVSFFKVAKEAGCRAVGLCADDFMGIKIRDRSKPLANAPLSPEELRTLRRETPLPFVLKGIMTVEDAVQAADAGVDAIVVSNHGGRVLDCCQAPMEVLPDIVEAVGGRIEILMDGGFRRGTDVLKALALGARAVLVGRPICWGLAAAGAEGVTEVLEIMRNELVRSMMLTGVSDLLQVPRGAIAPLHRNNER